MSELTDVGAGYENNGGPVKSRAMSDDPRPERTCLRDGFALVCESVGPSIEHWRCPQCHEPYWWAIAPSAPRPPTAEMPPMPNIPASDATSSADGQSLLSEAIKAGDARTPDGGDGQRSVRPPDSLAGTLHRPDGPGAARLQQIRDAFDAPHDLDWLFEQIDALQQQLAELTAAIRDVSPSAANRPRDRETLETLRADLLHDVRGLTEQLAEAQADARSAHQLRDAAIRECEQAEALAVQQGQALTALREAAGALITKLDVIIPLVDGVLALQQIRTGVSYRGPKLVEELTILRALLPAASGPETP